MFNSNTGCYDYACTDFYQNFTWKSNVEMKIYFMAVEFSDYEYTYTRFFDVWNHVLFDYISYSWITEWKKNKKLSEGNKL